MGKISQESIREFAQFCSEQNERLHNPKTEGEKLRNRIMFTKFKSNDEALELEKEVEAFFRSDASDEDKKLVGGYTESLGMICNAIREGRIDLGKEISNGQF